MDANSLNRRDVLGLAGGALGAAALTSSHTFGADMPRDPKTLSFQRDLPVT